jgi:PIN domain nuclease of toxin-antitoxin system
VGALSGAVRYLLDTHVLLWWLFDDERLSETARALVSDPEHHILVSSASAWEIATKHRLGKLPSADVLVTDITGWVRKARFGELAVTIAHAQRAGSWTQAHRDPFDRMLAAQSSLEDIPLISVDPALRTFGVDVLW